MTAISVRSFGGRRGRALPFSVFSAGHFDAKTASYHQNSDSLAYHGDAASAALLKVGTDYMELQGQAAAINGLRQRASAAS